MDSTLGPWPAKLPPVCLASRARPVQLSPSQCFKSLCPQIQDPFHLDPLFLSLHLLLPLLSPQRSFYQLLAQNLALPPRAAPHAPQSWSPLPERLPPRRPPEAPSRAVYPLSVVGRPARPPAPSPRQSWEGKVHSPLCMPVNLSFRTVSS